MVDAGVLEEPPHDADDADPRGQGGHAGPQRADATHAEVDIHASLGRAVQRRDDVRVGEPVELGPDPGAPARPGVRRFPIHELDHALQQVRRRHQDLAERRAGGLRRSRELVEQIVQVGPERFVRRQEPEIGIERRRHGVVVAGPDVHVAPDTALLAAHDESRLGVGFQLDEAVHDPDPRLLELPGPVDVSLLVEPCLELDEDEHFLAARGSAEQRVDDPRVSPRTVQRELDRHDVGVVRRLDEQPLDARLERVVGMVHQDVAFGEGREHGLGGRDGDATAPGRVVQLRLGEAGDLPKGPEAQEAHRLVQVAATEGADRRGVFEQQLP